MHIPSPALKCTHSWCPLGPYSRMQPALHQKQAILQDLMQAQHSEGLGHQPQNSIKIPETLPLGAFFPSGHPGHTATCRWDRNRHSFPSVHDFQEPASHQQILVSKSRPPPKEHFRTLSTLSWWFFFVQPVPSIYTSEYSMGSLHNMCPFVCYGEKKLSKIL